MHDAPRFARPLLAEDGKRLVVGVAAVHDERLARPACDVDLAAEHTPLVVLRREVAEEVEAHLAEGYHLGLGVREPLHLVEVGVDRVTRVVRVNAHRRPHVGQPPGERHDGVVGVPVRPDRDHAAHAGRSRALEDGGEIVREVGDVQVRVGVEEPHLAPMIAQGVTVKRSRPTSWPPAVTTSTR